MAVGWLLVAAIECLAWRAEHAEPEGSVLSPRADVPEESTAWDLEEILAPLPGDEQL